jgi:hypothetical protein
MPFLLDPASVCRPHFPLVPAVVCVADELLHAAGAALVVAPLATSCARGRDPTPVLLRRTAEVFTGLIEDDALAGRRIVDDVCLTV